jgi:uncharacterized membrane protein YkvA (DUF1232 family)
MDRSIAQVVDGFKELAHVPQMARLFAALFLDKRVPLWLKVCAAAGAVYVISPIDVIPDRVTGVGYLDDIILVVLIVQTFIEMSPDYVVNEHCARLGIDSSDIHVNVTQAVASSIGAVLPLLDGGGGNGRPAGDATRYSAYQDDSDNEEDEVSQPPASSQRPGRYSAYSTAPQQG